MKEDAHETIARAGVKLLLREPFYAHVLAALVRRVGTHTPTAGVSFSQGRWTLHVNPSFFGKLKADERVAVLKHELLHIVLQHVTRRDPQHHDRLLHNIAADIVVNQLVGKWPLPESAVTLATFPNCGLMPDETLDAYYRKLLKAAEEQLEKLERLGGGWHSDHGAWEAKDGVGASLAESELGRLLGSAKQKTGHQAWGSLPGQIREAVDDLLARQQPRADWRRSLRIFAASARATGVTDTMRQPSQRYGTFPGTRIRRRSHLLVALDTSGSIDHETMRMFFEELHHLVRAGAMVDVVECDATVQRHYPWRGKVPGAVKGGGGTSFDPVFRWLRESAPRRYDGCVYLTDGYAGAPQVSPPCRVLWALTPTGSDVNLRFGTHLRLEANR